MNGLAKQSWFPALVAEFLTVSEIGAKWSPCGSRAVRAACLAPSTWKTLWRRDTGTDVRPPLFSVAMPWREVYRACWKRRNWSLLPTTTVLHCRTETEQFLFATDGGASLADKDESVFGICDAHTGTRTLVDDFGVGGDCDIAYIDAELVVLLSNQAIVVCLRASRQTHRIPHGLNVSRRAVDPDECFRAGDKIFFELLGKLAVIAYDAESQTISHRLMPTPPTPAGLKTFQFTGNPGPYRFYERSVGPADQMLSAALRDDPEQRVVWKQECTLKQLDGDHHDAYRHPRYIAAVHGVLFTCDRWVDHGHKLGRCLFSMSFRDRVLFEGESPHGHVGARGRFFVHTHTGATYEHSARRTVKSFTLV